MVFSFVIVNYNNSLLTIECLESILKIELDLYTKLKIIVVDNNSIENEKKKLVDWSLKDKNKLVGFIFSDSNLGYFKAINLGLNVLSDLEKKSYIVIGNNDLKFGKYFLNNLITNNYSKDTFAISPNIINNSGLHQNPHLRGKMSMIKRIYYRLYNSNYLIAMLFERISYLFPLRASQNDKREYEKSQFITLGFGACYILTANFFIANRKLDDYLFLMGEEAMFANQILKSGGRTYYDSSLIVYHNDKSTFKNLPSKTIFNFNKESYHKLNSRFSYSELYDRKIE